MTALTARLGRLMRAWADQKTPRPDLVEPELTALAAEIVALITDQGNPTRKQDLDALASASGKLWHRLEPGQDRSEAHWHGLLDGITLMLGLAINAQADETEIRRALTTRALAMLLRALAGVQGAPTNGELAEQCGLTEETVSHNLQVARGLGLVSTDRLGCNSYSSLTGPGWWAVKNLLNTPADLPLPTT